MKRPIRYGLDAQTIGKELWQFGMLSRSRRNPPQILELTNDYMKTKYNASTNAGYLNMYPWPMPYVDSCENLNVSAL